MLLLFDGFFEGARVPYTVFSSLTSTLITLHLLSSNKSGSKHTQQQQSVSTRTPYNERKRLNGRFCIFRSSKTGYRAIL